MRRITRPIVHPLTLALLAAFAGGMLALACAPESTETEERPSDDELLAFYTEFCVDWEGCEDSSWTVAECAAVQIDAYGKLPTACLNRVIEFHRCAIALECEQYLDIADRTCDPAEDAIHDVDCGGMAAP